MLDLFASPTERKILRPHQERAIDGIRSSLRLGNRRVVLSAVTGFGKTLVSSRLVEGALAKGNSVVFTAPMISIIDQTVEAFEAEGIRSIGVMQSDHARTDPSAKVQIASVETLNRRGVPPASLVIVDECHHQHKAINKLMDERPDVFFIGLSATPWAKGMGLRWQDLVIPCTIGHLIDGGFLSKFTAYAPDVPDLARVRVEGGEYAKAQLAEVMGDAHLVGSVVGTWLEKGENRPTLVFGVDCAHAGRLAGQFVSHGVAAAYVDGSVDSEERRAIFARYRAGEVRVICSVRTMTTGVDLPVSCIVDAAPTRSEMLHVQKIGRGLRVNPGTEDLLILDHAGNSLRLGLVTDIHHSTLDRTKKGDRQKSLAKAEKLPKPCTGCGALHAGPICPACGKPRRRLSAVEEADGQLVEVAGRKPKVTTAEKARRLAGLRWIAQSRGYKPGWAMQQFRQWHGTWPPSGMDPRPEPPTAEVANWVKSRQIAWAKAQAKRSAA